MTEKYTQTLVNQLLGFNLVVDGFIGNKSKNALIVLDEALETVFKNKKYKTEERNMIGIRMSDKYTNKFSDMCVLWYPDKPELTRLLPMSTVPGLYGLGNIFNPKKIVTKTFPNGYSGVAVLCEGQYIDVYRLYDSLFGWSGAPFLMQEGAPVKIGRDGDKDWDIDPQVFETGFFGINMHSWKGWFSDVVNNLSQGCQVFKRDVFDLMLVYLREFVKYDNNNLLTYTLLNSKDFK